MKRMLAIVLATIICLVGSLSYLPTWNLCADESSAGSYIAVDINGYENRSALKSASFEDWTISRNTDKARLEVNGISFVLYDKSGAKITGNQRKQLVNATYSPVLTCDGVSSANGLVMEISGLSKGEHTISTYHNNYDDGSSNSSAIIVSVNGKENERITPSFRVNYDKDASITCITFTVDNDSPVVLNFDSAKDKSYKKVVLNAFEIDGAHPTKAIKNAHPEDHEEHFDQDTDEFSWESGEGAVSHDIYLGTDYDAVSSADHSSDEFMGNQTDNTYKASGLSHMSRHYWRVDEVDADGNVTKGKVMWFDVVHLAFPSAEGYGRYAKAGRGGIIYEVTTLEDGYEKIEENGVTVSKPIAGSLRYAIEELKGPRIVVFKVGGIIKLTKKLTIPNDGGNIYVAGQTATGDGITLINYGFGTIGGKDIVIRNVRVRVGDSNGTASDGMGLASADYCIYDHCSISWTTDEGVSSRSAMNITFQNNIIAEALNNSVHYKPGDDPASRPEGSTECHSFAGSISGNIGSFHHNLLVNNTGRNWSLAGGLESDGTPAGYLDISNNVVYNWRDRTNDGGVLMLNLVGNYYKMGAVTKRKTIANMDSQTITYADGNMMVDKNGKVMLNYNQDGWNTGFIYHNDVSSESLKRSEPLYPNYITLERADKAYETVLASAGAIYPKRDYLDTRYVEETKNGSFTYIGSRDKLYGIIDSQEDVGGYPTDENFKGGEAALDSDHDGMPDDWEVKHGLNPNDYSDNALITLSAEGYTNVEMYLNELMGDKLVWLNENQKPDASDDSDVPTATPEVTTTPEETAKPVNLGDVNDDGVIDATDALLVLKHAAKLNLLDESAKNRANVNGDELIDASDALEILKFVAHLITEFKNQ